MIAIGSDHGGVNLKALIKNFVESKGYEAVDFGTFDNASCDYPDYAKKVCDAVVDGEAECGILVCGTGIGMSLAANKVKGIRAAVCGDYFSAKFTRAHNDSNILCLGQRVVGEGLAIELVKIFLATEFEGGRHATRVNKIEEIENEQ